MGEHYRPGQYPFHNSDEDKYIDKYWKYKNPDPSTEHYSTIIANEILEKINDDIDSNGRRIYDLRPKAILVQDLRHAVLRKLLSRLLQRVREIDHYEQANSGDMSDFVKEYGNPEKQI